MASIVEGFEYDIFISYRQKDNKGDRWVSEFVEALKTELESTFKEEISVYFDINPHDGLLETHDVNASLKEKLKCLIFIPIISQTYCDSKSFAWQQEFCVFNKLTKEDQFGRDIRLAGGNVASRILPVKIHDLDPEDKNLLENELGGVLRSIDFIYKSAGVNRPLRANEDHPQDNLNKTYYRDQINKVANAVKEIITAIKKYNQQDGGVSKEAVKSKPDKPGNRKSKILIVSSLIIALIVIGFLFIPKLFRSSGQLDKSIAVLPFINDSPNEENIYFINGIMEEVLNNLQSIKDLRVISRTSVEQYRNQTKSIPEIAKELSVNYIVEGSAQKSGNTFRLRVQLIKAAKESHLWAKSYEQQINEVNDIFSIQSQIAEAIAAELEAVITPQEKQLIEEKPTDNLEAYRLYTVGNFFMSQWGEDNFRKAIDNYKQAIVLDSGFAQAYANLASAYYELTMWDVPKPYTEFIPQARDCALKALKINKNLGEAYFVIGSIKYIHELDFDGAEQAFKKGMELSPNYVWGRISYTNFLTAMGRYKESITISQQSLKLNPLDHGTYVELGYAMFRNGQDKEALELFNKSLELKPNNYNTIGCLTEFYSNKGIINHFLSDQIDTLMGSPRNDIRKISTSNLSYAGLIFAKVGYREEALAILDELNRRVEEGKQISQMDLGFIYNGLGDYEKAIDFFEKGFNEKESWVWIMDQCRDDSIRSNKRFKELIREMGFEK
ncbi:MAG: tetratricopeptide repeat protein [Bacteroidia bacterium]|nr:tetratricopeptide repeat protein [Bacteroidia bacterium]